MRYCLLKYAWPIGLVFALMSCSSPSAPLIPTDTISLAPTSIISPSIPAASPSAEDSTRTGIQQTLDRYAAAYNQRDSILLAQTVDTTNLPFRQLVLDRFRLSQESALAGTSTVSYTLQAITLRDHGFVQAHILQADGMRVDWLFRPVNGRWVLSEPEEAQLGTRRQFETAHFRFVSYAWADDINQPIADLMEQAYVIVQKRLGKAPEKKVRVYIRPIYNLAPQIDVTTTAAYDSSVRTKDLILVTTPHSFKFPAYDPNTGWQPELRAILTHEYTHLVNDTQFIPLVRMPDWMSEGLAEYVAEHVSAESIRQVVRASALIPIRDPSGHGNNDLEHMNVLVNDRWIAYTLAYTLVAFINERYGGMNGFWKLANAYDKAQELDTALRDAFGISYDQFDTAWRAWLNATYSP